MERRKIAVIGGGPAGFTAAVSAAENAVSRELLQIDIFEKSVPLKTILYTGNGRCNLSNNIFDYRDLAANYPRGEKFLYSVFSRFGVADTLQWMESGGLETYVQNDNRIFPKTDRAASVRTFFLKKAEKNGINILKQGVEEVLTKNNKFFVSGRGASFEYDAVILCTGGNRDSARGYEIARRSGHKITELKPSLTSLITREKWVKNLAGVSIKNAQIRSFFNKKKISGITGDFVFTHKGLAGPAVFDSSAYSAFLNYSPENPLILRINFIPLKEKDEIHEKLSTESDKSASNALKSFIPKSLAIEILKNNGINPDKKLSSLNAQEMVINLLTGMELRVVSPAKDGEIVTAGGVELTDVDSRTMESKLVKNLFFCGEILNIDGLTGGFNLQMSWSTGYIAGLNSV